MKTYWPDTDDNAAGETLSIAGSYTITETDQPGIWGKRNFRIEKKPDAGRKEYTLSGFTNQGINVQATLSQARLQFPRQSVQVTPEGGDGKLQWSIDMEASATCYRNTLELRYRIFEPDSSVSKGTIRAQKIR